MVSGAQLWLGLDAGIEGWLVLAVFFVGVAIDIVVFVYRRQHGADLRSAMIGYLVWIGILSAALIAVGFATGERPRWHWGD
ncbi:MAG TPA: hypothetical protein VME45_18125 [Stellaceae bacterium]|nr:hypothetical protein [Stellaceae bacterium]